MMTNLIFLLVGIITGYWLYVARMMYRLFKAQKALRELQDAMKDLEKSLEEFDA